MSKLNWERAARKDRLTYVPSLRSQPSTQKQLDYIVDLSHQKGKPPPRRLPLTKQGASDLIERLKELPDVNEPQRVRLSLVPPPNDNQEILVELRNQFNLSPQTISALMQLLGQIDPIGVHFFFDSLLREDLPQDQDALLIHILKEFVSEYA